MRRVLGAGAVLVVLALAASPASASTQIGSPCVADDVRGNSTLLALGSGIEAIPTGIADIPSGVITRWQVRVGASLPLLRQSLRVFYPIEGKYAGATEIVTETVAPGLNSFAARIPIPTGAVVGLSGPEGALACNDEPGAASGLFVGELTSDPATFQTVNDLGTPVLATVEPDVDFDGYGDETQDGCPRSRWHQGACPVVRVSVADVVKNERAILVVAQGSSHASVELFGRVGGRWRLRAGEPKPVTARHDARLRLPLPAAVKIRLRRLLPRQSLRARIVVRSTDLGGRVKQRELTVRLPGQRRPSRP